MDNIINDLDFSLKGASKQVMKERQSDISDKLVEEVNIMRKPSQILSKLIQKSQKGSSKSINTPINKVTVDTTENKIVVLKRKKSSSHLSVDKIVIKQPKEEKIILNKKTDVH